MFQVPSPSPGVTYRAPNSFAAAPFYATAVNHPGPSYAAQPCTLASQSQVRQHFEETVQIVREHMFSDQAGLATGAACQQQPPSPGTPAVPLGQPGPAAAAAVSSMLAPTPPTSPHLMMRPVVAPMVGTSTPMMPTASPRLVGRGVQATTPATAPPAAAASSSCDSGGGASTPRTRLAAVVTVVPPPGHSEPLPTATSLGGGVLTPKPSPRDGTPRAVSVRPVLPSVCTPPVPAAWSQACQPDMGASVPSARAASPAAQARRLVSAPITASVSVAPPVKVVGVRRVQPAGSNIAPETSPEVECESPEGTSTTISPKVQASNPSRLVARPQRTSSPGHTASMLTMEERLQAMELQLNDRNLEVSRLQQYLSEVQDSLAEHKDRAARDLQGRDRHIEELSRRNQQLLAAHQDANKELLLQATQQAAAAVKQVSGAAEVAPDISDLSSQCVEDSQMGVQDGTESSPPTPCSGAQAGCFAGVSATGADGAAGGSLDDPKMPTLAALRQRLYPKHGQSAAAQTRHLGSSAASTHSESEASSRGIGRNGIGTNSRTSTRSAGTFGTAPNPRLPARRGEQQVRTPPRGGGGR